MEVTIDGICTMALVDTGAMRSVMSLSFKNRLRRKVMFSLDTHAKFRGVSGEILRPLGVCAVNVLLADKCYLTEFVILERCTHDVILGIDFLQTCGASVNCGAGELSINSGKSADGSCLSRSVIIRPRESTTRWTKNVCRC